MAFDPKWEAEFYFDRRTEYDGLRIMQRYAGPQTVEFYKELFIGDRRKRLLDKVSLLALVCGAGKTLLMVAILMHINRIVIESLGKGPRCSKILWFVKERALAEQLLIELQTEIVAVGLHDIRPRMQICDKSGDLDRDPGRNVITISCPNALWERSNQRRSDEQIMEILSRYDTIIWDECDFASQQIRRLVRLSPHALKFGLTASPIDADGDFIRECFVLASNASYRNVFDQDYCLKNFLPWDEATRDGYVRAFGHDGFTQLIGGVETDIRTGQHGDKHSLPGAWAAIAAALDDCSRLEAEMRDRWPVDWYSPHILITCEARPHAEAVTGYINDHLKQFRDRYYGDGWRATMMFDGLKDVDRVESALFHREKELIHPFFRAHKLNNGRCDRLSSRILVVVDMAIRGMNNWPILFIVDIKRSGSVNIQVQTKGRDFRLPMRLRHLVGHELFADFCTGRYYYPESGNNAASMASAYDFIFNMDDKIVAAQLPHWDDLLHDRPIEEIQPKGGTRDPFTLGDRLRIDTELTRKLAQGEIITPEISAEIINELSGEVSDERREQAKTHIKRVLDPSNKKYRSDFVTGQTDVKIIPVATEQPALSPSIEILRSFLVHRSIHRAIANKLLPKLETDELIKELIEREYLDYHKRYYRPPPKLFQLHATKDNKNGVLDRIAVSFLAELRQNGLGANLGFSDLIRAVNSATSDLTGIANTGNDGLLDDPSYHHVLVLPHNQQRIKGRAIGILMRYGALDEIAPIYADVL